jgi:hypothetical protein
MFIWILMGSLFRLVSIRRRVVWIVWIVSGMGGDGH